MSGLKASSECIPFTRSRTREVAGWTDHVKPERDRSVFWHCMWLEYGKPKHWFHLSDYETHSSSIPLCGTTL